MLFCSCVSHTILHFQVLPSLCEESVAFASQGILTPQQHIIAHIIFQHGMRHRLTADSDSLHDLSHDDCCLPCRHWNLSEPHPRHPIHPGSRRCGLLCDCGIHGLHSCRAGLPGWPQHHPGLHQLQQPPHPAPAYRLHLSLLPVRLLPLGEQTWWAVVTKPGVE